uniref:Uncharacterized protein n=1 Tax=Sinocyclocheilus grahami TaxID=75366 RepID=A0A672L6F4_SINGR
SQFLLLYHMKNDDYCLHQAYTPSPCRGSGCPGMHKTIKRLSRPTLCWLEKA